jgi:hypothetical protein
MLKKIWITLPISLLCALAQADTVTIAQPAPANTLAAPAAATSTAAAPKKEEAPSVKYNFTYEAGYTVQSQTQPDGSRSQSGSHGFKPGLSYGEYRAGATFEYEQDLIDSEADTWSDPVLTLSKKAWVLNDYLKLGPSGALVLPLKDSTRNEVGLMYGISGALTLSLNTKTLGMDSWSLGYQLSMAKNFTSFDTNAKTGNPNRSYRIRNRITTGYNLPADFSLFAMFDFNSDYSINGVVTNSFLALQSLGYSINDNVSLSFSHANGGAYLKSSTYENNLKLYDTENSSYSLGLEVSL